jgi:putative NADH-flavin reductase
VARCLIHAQDRKITQHKVASGGDMKIVLLGANGRTGRQVLSRALDAGDTVTAFVRAEDRLADMTHPQLSIRAGNVCDPNALKHILPGHDAVISTLGPRTPTKAACAIYSESATAIVAAMQECGVNRLLVTSTALLFPSDRLLDRILRFIARHNAHSAGLMEQTIGASNLDWTIARTVFLNDKDTMSLRISEDGRPDGASSVSRSAVADFLLTEARESNHLKRVVGLRG